MLNNPLQQTMIQMVNEYKGKLDETDVPDEVLINISRKLGKDPAFTEDCMSSLIRGFKSDSLDLELKGLFIRHNIGQLSDKGIRSISGIFILLMLRMNPRTMELPELEE